MAMRMWKNFVKMYSVAISFPSVLSEIFSTKPTGGLLPAPSTLPPTEPASGPCVSCSVPSRSILPAYSLTRLPAFPSPPPLRDPLCWWSEDPDQSCQTAAEEWGHESASLLHEVQLGDTLRLDRPRRVPPGVTCSRPQSPEAHGAVGQQNGSSRGDHQHRARRLELLPYCGKQPEARRSSQQKGSEIPADGIASDCSENPGTPIRQRCRGDQETGEKGPALKERGEARRCGAETAQPVAPEHVPIPQVIHRLHDDADHRSTQRDQQGRVSLSVGHDDRLERGRQEGGGRPMTPHRRDEQREQLLPPGQVTHGVPPLPA